MGALQEYRPFLLSKDLRNGEWLYTKVSFGSGEIPKNLFKRILKEQLKISLELFNKNS
jgi:hypothetical protein